MKRFLWLGFVLFLYLICSGCGDTFRPIIIPNPPQFPNPAASHTVVSINDNGTFVAGSAMAIDVSGDSVMSIANADIHPVYAVQQSASQVLVLNQAVTEAGTGTTLGTTSCLLSVPPPPNTKFVYDVCPTLTLLNFFGTTIGGTSSITLPIYSSPNFVAVAPSATTAYVTLPTYPPDPTQPATIVPSVGVVGIGASRSVTVIPVVSTPPGGTPPLSNPYALAVTPDNTKLYVANNSTPCNGSTGICSISAFTAANQSLTTRGISGPPLSSPPIWLSARSDSQVVYVLEASGELAYISITSTTGPDMLTEDAGISVPGAASMLYDGNKNRLYIPWFNPTATQGELAILDVSQPTPQPLGGGPIKIDPVLSSARTPDDVCSTFSPDAVSAAAVTALPDGSRAYVGSYASFEVDVNITGAAPNSDLVHTTYNYSLQSPIDLLPGMVITISGVTSKLTNPSVFNGTFAIVSVGGGTFEVANAPSTLDAYTGGGSAAAPNICPQVTVIDAVSYAVRSKIAVPGFAAFNAFCALPVSQQGPRFRFTMAAGGDSTRAYLASCDGENVNIIDTSTDSYIESQPAPIGVLPPIPPNPLNSPQNPVFLLAGP